MNRLKFIMALLFCFLMHQANTQQAEIIRQYIETYKELAVAEMQRTGVPAAIKLAQGIHETGAGTSTLVKKSNNHFGIKCKSNWTGPSVKHTDDARNECFRKYKSADASYLDHSDFLKNSARYASLFQLDPTDYESWAYGLKKAGYATHPKYAQTLIKLIEDYNLQDYTLIALGKMNGDQEIFAKSKNDTDRYKSGPAGTETGTDNKSESDIRAVKNPEPLPVLYPHGEFKINETKVVFVAAGTSYLSLAVTYNLPLQRIFEFNDMTASEAADKDRLIYLQRKRKTGKNDYHIVQPGESLHDIAQQQALRLESLLEYNWLSADMQPAPGEKLYLKNKAPGKPRLVLKESYSLTNFQ
jgi:hypothetical protein